MLYRFCRALLRFIFFLMYRLKAEGLENIPAEGAVIICCNHRSNLDPPLLGTPLQRQVMFMAKDELFRIPLLGPFISRLGAFPVKRGGVSMQSIRLALNLLKQGNVMAIFPEGSRRNAGEAGKKGAASLAIRSQATVIPAAIIGTYRPFSSMKIVFGKPLDLTAFADGSSQALEEATEHIMQTIRQMVTAHKR